MNNVASLTLSEKVSESDSIHFQSQDIKIHHSIQRIFSSHLFYAIFGTALIATFSIAVIPIFLLCTKTVTFIAFSILGISLLVYFSSLAFDKQRLLYEFLLNLNIICTIFFPNQFPWVNEIPIPNYSGKGKIYLSALPLKNFQHHILFQQANVTDVLTITQDFETSSLSILGDPVTPKDWKAKNIKTLQIHSFDFQSVSSKNLHQGAEHIHQVIEKNGIIVVHCKSGRSRSAQLITAYFMKYQQQSLQEAIVHIKKQRPQVFLNYKLKCLQELESSLSPQKS